METYVVNGKEIQYDTFEAANIELYLSEVKRISDSANAAKAAGTDVMSAMRERCFNIMDFFDTVIGEGTAETLFGGAVNIRDVAQAFKDFTESVNRNMTELAGVISGKDAPVQRPDVIQYSASANAANREQRRAAARAKSARKAVTDIGRAWAEKEKENLRLNAQVVKEALKGMDDSEKRSVITEVVNTALNLLDEA